MKLLKKKIKPDVLDPVPLLDTSPISQPGDIQPYPEHLVNSPEPIGFPSLEFQEDIYRISSQGVFGSEITSILDVGCGRGDFGSYVKRVVNADIEYTGIDLNPLHIEIGKQKFANVGKFNLVSGNVLDYSHTADICVINSIFDNNYDNHAEDKYEYFKKVLIKSLDISNMGVVVLALNDRFENEPYITYDMSAIVHILTEFELKFSLENAYQYPNVFKLMIQKQTF